MNLDLTSKQMEILLSLTANNSINGEEYYDLWHKVSKEFRRRYDEVKAGEKFKKEHGVSA
jgi:flavoprotein